MYSKQCVILLITIIYITTAAGKLLTVKVTPLQVLSLRDISKKCADEAGVDPSILAKLVDGTIDEDEPSKAFTYCLCLNYGYIDKDGNMNVSKMLEHEVVKGTTDQYIEKIKECDQVRKERMVDTIFAKASCLDQFIESMVIRPST